MVKLVKEHEVWDILQFISADTNELLCSCTGEGQGETDADDIRQAINNALSSLFFEYNDNQF